MNGEHATGAMSDQPRRGSHADILDRIQTALRRPTSGLVDIEPARLMDIIKGERTPSSLDIAKIADACKVPVWWLITGEMEEPSAGSVQSMGGKPPDPPIVAITINTRKPDKWLFLDTETAEVWRWSNDHFRLAGREEADGGPTPG